MSHPSQYLIFCLGTAFGALACTILFTPMKPKSAYKSKSVKHESTTVSKNLVPLKLLDESQRLDIDEDGKSDRLLRKAETVLLRRTARVILVIELSTDSHNYTAIIRTAECLGVQHIWVVKAPISIDEKTEDESLAILRNAQKYKKSKAWETDKKEFEEHTAFARQAANWVSIRNFSSTEEVNRH